MVDKNVQIIRKVCDILKMCNITIIYNFDQKYYIKNYFLQLFSNKKIKNI